MEYFLSNCISKEKLLTLNFETFKTFYNIVYRSNFRSHFSVFQRRF